MNPLVHLERLFRSNIAFCLYSLPQSDDLMLFVKGPSNQTDSISFLMKPFSKESAADEIKWSASYHGPASEYGFTDEFVPRPSMSKGGTHFDMDKEVHAAAVETIKTGIGLGEYDKVVLSREQTIMKSSDALQVFMHCQEAYQRAFCYLMCNEKGACWLGASPELLLSREDESYSTVSLAGTKKPDQSWTDKEYVEQQIVTDFISDNLKRAGAESIELEDTGDEAAGAIRHLRTRIHCRFTGDESVLLDALHPTPAVCGHPRMEAKAVISDVEAHDRRYYTGFIGFKGKSISRYFVNLRCASFYSDATVLYAGGGIVIGSDPEQEWNETVNKMNTLKQFL